MKKIFIIIFCFIVIILLAIGFSLSFNNENIDIKNYCKEKQHYFLGQCPNGDYVTGNNMVYDLQGRHLMYFGTFGKKMSIRGWWREKFLKEVVGCLYSGVKSICNGNVIIN